MCWIHIYPHSNCRSFHSTFTIVNDYDSRLSTGKNSDCPDIFKGFILAEINQTVEHQTYLRCILNEQTGDL